MVQILVVDDDGQDLAWLRETLERADYDVLEASGGVQAMQLLGEKEIDLAVIDLIMPDMDGIEMIGKLRKQYPGVKIVAISGGGRVQPETYLGIAKQFGAVRALAKPISQDELLHTVRGVLG